MQIEAISAVLRPRNRWEAIDLGFAMTRHWLLPIYSVWFVVLIPLTLLLHLLCWRQIWLVPFLLWWLKPLLDRIPLFVLSRALFGAVPDTRGTLKNLPGQLRPQALQALTWLRFDPARSFHLPVIQLEGLNGKQRRQRQRILDSTGGSSGGGWLTVTCLNLEIAMQLALVAAFGLMFPEFAERSLQIWFNQDHTRSEQIILNLVAVGAFSLIEPFYVGAGFALYLNRRTRLEAWDIEIGFRRLAERLRKSLGATAALLLLIAVGGAPGPAMAAADTVPAAPIEENPRCKELTDQHSRLRQSDSTVKQALAEVLQERDFPFCEKVTRWRLKDSDEPKPERQADQVSLKFGEGVEWLLWGLLALALGLLLFWLRKQRPLSMWSKPALPAEKNASLMIHGEEIKAEAFSSDAASAAWRLWQSGAKRDAAALLYRASLTGLMTRHGIDFGISATEGECLQQAARQLRSDQDSTVLAFFRRQTAFWQMTAYAHRFPPSAEMENLCRQWDHHFAAEAQPGSGAGEA